MQRFFSAFPDRLPGAGLLLLRVVAGAAAIAHSGSYLAQSPAPTPAVWAIVLMWIAGGLAIVVGFVTPAAATAVAVTTMVMAVNWQTAVLVTTDAIVLALVGPGAHSIDAYLFGRREIIIPHESARS